MPIKKPSANSFEFHPLTRERWKDLEELFGQRGACGGCWCMWWRLPPRQFRRQKGEENKKALRNIVNAGEILGVLAYQNGQPIGWCAVAPRPDYPRLANSRILQAVDDQPVWSITCLFVAKAIRRRGVSVELLRAASRFAAIQGAAWVEGYPVESTKIQPDPFVYTGLASAFRQAGFKEVLRRSPSRPIMRWAARPCDGGGCALYASPS